SSRRVHASGAGDCQEVRRRQRNSGRRVSHHNADMRITLLAFTAASLTAQVPVQYGRTIFRGAPVTFRVQKGRAIFDGDIDLGPADELDEASPAPKARASIYLANTQARWPNGVVPYIVDSDVPNAQRISDATTIWNSRTPIHLVPRAAEANYV